MLPREIIKRVREIQVRTGRQVADVLAGQYESVFKGRGIEFDEVRPYLPGDDVRSIDWNVTARMGAPFIKKYVEERQLTLMLMADVSASLNFGSTYRSKREAAAELCALLAFSATRNEDKVGLVLFHGKIEQYIPPRKGQRHSLRVVREVLAHGDDNEQRAPQLPQSLPWRRQQRLRSALHDTNISGAVEFLMSVTARKTVCFVVSDFFDDDYVDALQAANRKHDVIAVLITDPRELSLPNIGLVRLRDGETGKISELDTSSSRVRSAFAEQASDRIDSVRTRLRSARIDFIHVDAAGSVVDPVAEFFRMRERRTRR